MSEYIVSARKYRPDSFETLIGQDNIALTLKNSILRGKLAHAYLFCGPRGVGKTSTARIFAKTINCSNLSPEMEPCGECESCKSFAEGRSYCIHELDAASNNGVDDIKTLMDQVQIPPQVGKYSVYIIDEVHMLSPSAFNAFLKTLEEPPGHAIFILATTEKHKILPTILSRCQTYNFNRISIPDMVNNLKSIASKEGVNIDDESLHIIAQKADGAMRDALTIFDQTVAFCGSDIRYEDVMRNLNVLDYEYSFKLINAFLEADYAAALLIFDEILTKGFNALHFISSLSSHLRDLIVSKTAGLDALLELPDSLKIRYKAQADKCQMRFLYDALDITTKCEAGFRASSNQRLHIEFALMKLAFLVKSPESAQPKKIDSQPEVSSSPGKIPQPEQVPASAPVKKTFKGAASLSLTSIMEEKESQARAKEDIKDDKVGATVPEDSIIIEKWKDLASQYTSQPRLSNAMTNAKLEISPDGNGKLLTFFVTNEAQQKWIREKKLREMEGRYQQLLSSSHIRLDVDVVPDTESKEVIYMPEEKAKALIESNPQVKDFVIDLELDIK